jgi:hypothetical protein
MSAPTGDLDLFRESLATALADAIGIPLNAVEAAVEAVTEDWSVEVHHMRPITDHHTGYIRRALADGCTWSRSCPDPAAAYYYNRRDQKRTIPHGICARHRPEAVENRFPVFDPPAEVKL